MREKQALAELQQGYSRQLYLALKMQLPPSLEEDEKGLLPWVELLAIGGFVSGATLHRRFITLTREEHVSVNALEV